MSTMSELDRLMKELHQEDMLHKADLKELAIKQMNDLHDIQAEEAFALEQAMREEMDPPAEALTTIDKTFISNNPDAKHLDTPF